VGGLADKKTRVKLTGKVVPIELWRLNQINYFLPFFFAAFFLAAIVAHLLSNLTRTRCQGKENQRAWKRAE
jgi:hypothetical protein